MVIKVLVHLSLMQWQYMQIQREILVGTREMARKRGHFALTTTCLGTRLKSVTNCMVIHLVISLKGSPLSSINANQVSSNSGNVAENAPVATNQQPVSRHNVSNCWPFLPLGLILVMPIMLQMYALLASLLVWKESLVWFLIWLQFLHNHRLIPQHLILPSCQVFTPTCLLLLL